MFANISGDSHGVKSPKYPTLCQCKWISYGNFETPVYCTMQCNVVHMYDITQHMWTVMYTNERMFISLDYYELLMDFLNFILSPTWIYI